MHPGTTKQKATELRKLGFSLSEVASNLHISKSTASIWLNSTDLTPFAQELINKRKLRGRKLASLAIKIKHNKIVEQINSNTNTTLSSIDLNNQSLCKVLCSFLYWGEGGKTDNHVAFMNSDPNMIRTFMILFRRSFTIQENKFRGLVHIHEYHREQDVKDYWSKISQIPTAQFSKSYIKPHTGKTIRVGFMGTFKVKYFDSKIVYELKSIYNALSNKI